MDSASALRMFIRVVEAGSFSEAGRQLGIAPSSVSRQINDLEDSLSIRLFQRTTRKLGLTEAGQLYYERAARIISDIEEARLAVSQLDGTPTGILRLNVPGSLSKRYIIPNLIAFQQKYPGVEVVLLASDQVLDMIEYRIDLTLRLGTLSDSSLVAKKIGMARRIVCASEEYLKKNGVPEKPDDLVQHNCITFRTNPGNNKWKFKKGKQIYEINASGNLYTNDGESLVAAAVNHHGIIMVPEWLVSCEYEHGLLREILTGYTIIPEETPLYALYPRQRYLAPKVRVFIDFLAVQFGK